MQIRLQRATNLTISAISITSTWISSKEVLARWSMSMLTRMRLTRLINIVIRIPYYRLIKWIKKPRSNIRKRLIDRKPAKKATYLNSSINFNCLIKTTWGWPRLRHLFRKLIRRKKHQEYKCRVDFQNNLIRLRVSRLSWKLLNRLWTRIIKNACFIKMMLKRLPLFYEMIQWIIINNFRIDSDKGLKYNVQKTKLWHHKDRNCITQKTTGLMKNRHKKLHRKMVSKWE